MSRIPPPSCTGILTCLRIASTAIGVHGLAGEGAVEVDDVQVLETLILRRLLLAPADRG
jgi:hypothetical protein